MSKNKSTDWVRISIIIVAGILVLTIGIYIWKFPNGISSDVDNWKLYAALLSPFITFFSIFILYQSFKAQTKAVSNQIKTNSDIENRFQKEYNKENLMQLFKLIESVYQIYSTYEDYLMRLWGFQNDDPVDMYKKFFKEIEEEEDSFEEKEKQRFYSLVNEISILKEICIQDENTFKKISAYIEILHSSLIILFEKSISLVFRPHLDYYDLPLIIILKDQITSAIIKEVSTSAPANIKISEKDKTEIMKNIIKEYKTNGY